MQALSKLVREHALALDEKTQQRLLDLIGEAQVVMLGEASHGTHEFYQMRAAITRQLIEKKRFSAVAIEGDWPDTYRIHRYLQGQSTDQQALQALADFSRFPKWMWRNREVLNFVHWLKTYHESVAEKIKPVGFYGLDLYSLFASIEAVIAYLEIMDPPAALEARERYACFEFCRKDPQIYGQLSAHQPHYSCENQVVGQLLALRQKREDYLKQDGWIAEDEFFSAEQNARVVQNAEQYYRLMLRADISSWNLRDSHMFETLQALIRHQESRGFSGKAVLWAHNSHIGDARATEMGERGELNIGQLVRERYGRRAFSLGFTTYQGTVTAASNWGAMTERKQVRPAISRSYEDIFHESGKATFLLPLRGQQHLQDLNEPHLERAIGVIYRPETERYSHYFHSRILDQFDAVIHFDRTQALEPLETGAAWIRGEVPETYPTGF